MTNVARMLADSVAAHGDRPAIKLDDIVLSYTALDEASARAAGLLAERGVGPGDRVGLMLGNLPYFPMLLFGALRLGATVVPMNPLLKEREVAFHLSDSGSRHLFAWTGFAEPAGAGCEDAGAECVLVAPGEFEPMLGAADPVRSSPTARPATPR